MAYSCPAGNIRWSRREYQMINRRLKAGRYASMREGKYIGSVPPYGYEIYRLKGEKGNSLRPVPKEGAVVQRVFREFLAGRTQSAIAAGLNRCGIPSARGKRWTVSSIQSLLRNAHYAGYTVSGFRPSKKILRNGQLVTTRPRNSDLQLYPGRHDALISKEDYHRAMEILRTHQAPPVPKKSGASNPLSGLVICSCCGKKMQRRPLPNGQGAQLLCATHIMPDIRFPVSALPKRYCGMGSSSPHDRGIRIYSSIPVAMMH